MVSGLHFFCWEYYLLLDKLNKNGFKPDTVFDWTNIIMHLGLYKCVFFSFLFSVYTYEQ